MLKPLNIERQSEFLTFLPDFIDFTYLWLQLWGAQYIRAWHGIYRCRNWRLFLLLMAASRPLCISRSQRVAPWVKVIFDLTFHPIQFGFPCDSHAGTSESTHLSYQANDWVSSASSKKAFVILQLLIFCDVLILKSPFFSFQIVEKEFSSFFFAVLYFHLEFKRTILNICFLTDNTHFVDDPETITTLYRKITIKKGQLVIEVKATQIHKFHSSSFH